jgi:cobalamin biosynthesis Mg chelatase CobN
VWVTAQALAAAKRKPLPLRPVQRRAAPARAAREARSSRAGRQAAERSRTSRQVAEKGSAHGHSPSTASTGSSARPSGNPAGRDGETRSAGSTPAAHLTRSAGEGSSFPSLIVAAAAAVALVAIAWLARRRFSS